MGQHEDKKDKLLLKFKKLILVYRFKKYQEFLSKKIPTYTYDERLQRRVYWRMEKKIYAETKRYLQLFIRKKSLGRFWGIFKFIVSTHLSKIFKRVTFNTFILALTKENVNARIVSEFFFIRLKQFYTIWEILRNANFLFRTLMDDKVRVVRGYKITCSGRFSRKQRATYS
jgi:hypothetical protein